MTQYGRGYSFERKVAGDLESDGYWTIQSRGSHGLADVVGIKEGEVVLVQCKLGSIPGTEWNELYVLASRLGCLGIVADRPSRGTIRYRWVTGYHVSGSRVWPCELWTADRVGAA